MEPLRVTPIAMDLLRKLKVNMSVRNWDWQAARELMRKGYADLACGRLILTVRGLYAARSLSTKTARG
jgi:hypothetical protein